MKQDREIHCKDMWCALGCNKINIYLIM